MVQFTSHQRSGGNARVKKHLSSTAENALQQTSSIFNRELVASDYKLWGGILWEFTDAAVVWAFENWNRNGKFFPKPAEILELIHAYGSAADNQIKYCDRCKQGWIIVNPEASPADYKVVRCQCVLDAIAQAKIPDTKCDRECQRRHFRGYGEKDIRWLFKRRMASGDKDWSPARWESLLDELDGAKGQKPEWRQ